MNNSRVIIIAMFLIVMSLSLEQYASALSIDSSSSSHEIESNSGEESRYHHSLNKHLLDYIRSELKKRSFRAKAISRQRSLKRNYYFDHDESQEQNSNENFDHEQSLGRYYHKRGGKFAIPRMG